MALYSELPIYRDTYKLIIEVFNIVKEFPREHKYYVGDDMRKSVFLKDELMLTLHPNKLYLQHYTKGVKFIGTVINPYRKYIGNRTKGNLYRKVHEFNNKISKDNAPDLVATVNSYLGFMKYHSSYNIRKDVLVNKLDSRWKEFITISPDYLKINLKK